MDYPKEREVTEAILDSLYAAHITEMYGENDSIAVSLTVHPDGDWYVSWDDVRWANRTLGKGRWVGVDLDYSDEEVAEAAKYLLENIRFR